MDCKNIGCIRPAKLEDAPDILAIYLEIDPFRKDVSKHKNINLVDVIDWIESATKQKPLLVIDSFYIDKENSISPKEKKGKVAGWCSVEAFYGLPAFDNAREVSFYVSSEYQRLGVASALFDHLITNRHEIGFSHLVAYVYAENTKSLNFFSKQGFEEWGLLPDIAQIERNKQSVHLLGKVFPLS
ncbi:GNAT family N-acetyltransferase [Marinomonas sp. C2222]|uniref:GNAT family N-acetyltransferase n=1 Tax=Marinomonas sargassi TaxID=2984494 RepID=A0ABT2YTS1_9GAMM|nr:GNAT family N-acetyltransferase [Marinomonas sargassi]MCV2403297.1 GNAT family N-acetyltransferase [Marinomonas sargassi]